MRPLRFTISADGSSDSVLVPILQWAIARDHPGVIPDIQFVDYTISGRPPGTLERRLKTALRLFPCDVFVVHRDAETQPWSHRESEILRALESLPERSPAVLVIPVRMTEAWLLLDESAIRRAAGNPAGRAPLLLPSVSRLEQLPDPKSVLHESLRIASGLTGRRLRNVRPEQQARRVAELIQTFEPIEDLPAFQRFRESLQIAIQQTRE